jgi:hypothetical protein
MAMCRTRGIKVLRLRIKHKNSSCNDTAGRANNRLSIRRIYLPPIGFIVPVRKYCAGLELADSFLGCGVGRLRRPGVRGFCARKEWFLASVSIEESCAGAKVSRRRVFVALTKLSPMPKCICRLRIFFKHLCRSEGGLPGRITEKAPPMCTFCL